MQLRIVKGKNPGKLIELQEGSNMVGRWDPDKAAYPEIDLEEEDEDVKVSRKHAIVEMLSNAVTIEDLGSLNGTYLNRDKKLDPHFKYDLHVGDEIMVGRIVLKLEE